MVVSKYDTEDLCVGLVSNKMTWKGNDEEKVFEGYLEVHFPFTTLKTLNCGVIWRGKLPSPKHKGIQNVGVTSQDRVCGALISV